MTPLLRLASRHLVVIPLLLLAAGCDPAATTGEANACTDNLTACGTVDGSTCQPSGDSFICTCPSGFAAAGVGAKCEDIDECDDGAEQTCGVATASCYNSPAGTFSCACPAGFAHDGNGTPCVATPTGCAAGFAPAEADGTCEDVDECASGAATTCGDPGATCVNSPSGSFTCSCPVGFASAGAGKPCTAVANGCEPGYEPTGASGFCQDINECKAGSQAACGVAGSSCSNVPTGSFTCTCPAGYKAPGPGTVCDIAPNDCEPGYAPTGANGACQDVNECKPGGQAACGVAGATCTNSPLGSFTCSCPGGYKADGPGTLCDVAPNNCDAGYEPTGANGACQDVNECKPGGEAACGIAGASCSNTPAGSFTCSCPAGYKSPGAGQLCDVAPNDCNAGFAPTGTNGACQDINECKDGNAVVCGVSNASCSNKQGGFDCTCPAGWKSQGTGNPCVDADECDVADLTALCGTASATCTNKPGTFACACPSGFTLQTISGNTTGDGVKCIDIDECKVDGFCEAICKNSVGSAACVSTVSDEESPYWGYPCPAPDDRFINNKTDFDMDCRCSFTQLNRPSDPNHPDYEAFYRCNIVTTGANYSIGTGPSVREWRRDLGADSGATYLNGGFIDAAQRTLYIGTQWKDSTATDGNPEFTYYGAILAVDVDWDAPTVGNRTLVSGHTLTGDKGAGPTLRAVKDIKRGPDGKLYTMSWESGHPVQIMRVDDTTGDRELVWIEQQVLHGGVLPASQCHNGSTIGVDGTTAGNRYSLQMQDTGQAMAMAPNGDFFLGIKQAGPAKGPRGIVRISADGQSCEWVTRFAATNGNIYATKAAADQGADYGLPNGTGPRGGGLANFASNPVNIFYREDAEGVAWLYTLDGIGAGANGTRYYRVNVATGDREQLFSSIIGDSHSVWDPSREVLWTSGGFDTTRVVALDIIGHDGAPPTELGGLKCLTTTSTWYQCMRGPGDGDNQNRSGTFFDPWDNNLVIAHGSWGLVRVEPRTGNTYVFSR
jgi:hypothetical protein